MKVLYLASRTERDTTLELEREITALQRTTQTAAVDDVKFIFLPDVRLEEVSIELMRHRPEVLHISVHGQETGLRFRTEYGQYAELTATQLRDLLPNPPPRLILLNACDSATAAQELAQLQLVAIGSTAPITNQAAIVSGTMLYSRLLTGHTIQEAFRGMDAIVSPLLNAQNSLQLFCNTPGLDKRRLLRVPQIAARLPRKSYINSYGVSAKIGLVGCPSSTTQVCFFTDDPSFLDEKSGLEESQTEVVRDIARGGEVWTDELWTGDGDFRVGACGITGDGQTFASSAMLSEALQNYASIQETQPEYSRALAKALRYLEDNRGDGLSDWKSSKSRTTKKKRKLAAKAAVKAEASV